MSGRKWKPGDVAMVMPRGGDSLIGMRVSCGWEFGTGDLRDSDIQDVRPLAVIDPEDAGVVDHLLAAYYQSRTDRPDSSIRRMRAALRSLVEPPKPDEPTGLGAVIEDERGVRWVRLEIADGALLRPWGRVGNIGGGTSTWVEYADINAVRILSEGASDV